MTSDTRTKTPLTHAGQAIKAIDIIDTPAPVYRIRVNSRVDRRAVLTSYGHDLEFDRRRVTVANLVHAKIVHEARRWQRGLVHCLPALLREWACEELMCFISALPDDDLHILLDGRLSDDLIVFCDGRPMRYMQKPVNLAVPHSLDFVTRGEL